MSNVVECAIEIYNEFDQGYTLIMPLDTDYVNFKVPCTSCPFFAPANFQITTEEKETEAYVWG